MTTNQRTHYNQPNKILLIPAAGLGSRFKKCGYTTPKPLLEIGPESKRVPLLKQVIDDCTQCFGEFTHVIIGVSPEVYEHPLLTEDLYTCCIELPKTTRGAAETVFLMMNTVRDLYQFDRDDVVVIANSDQHFGAMAEAVPGLCLTFEHAAGVSDSHLEKWSYMTPHGVVEKPLAIQVKPTWEPTIGVYVTTVGDVCSCISRAIINDERHGPNMEFYLAPVLDLTRSHKVDTFIPLGTPEDYESFCKARSYVPSI